MVPEEETQREQTQKGLFIIPDLHGLLLEVLQLGHDVHRVRSLLPDGTVQHQPADLLVHITHGLQIKLLR